MRALQPANIRQVASLTSERENKRLPGTTPSDVSPEASFFCLLPGRQHYGALGNSWEAPVGHVAQLGS